MQFSGDAIQRISVVEYRLGVGRDTIYRLVKEGRLAKPKSLAGKRASGWLKSDVDKYLESLQPSQAVAPVRLQCNSPRAIKRRKGGEK